MHTLKSQLSFVPTVGVHLWLHPTVSPPDATGPFDTQAFEATLADWPGLCGWGRTEQAAIGALADQLRHRAADEPAAGSLTAFGQAFVAAERLASQASSAACRTRRCDVLISYSAITSAHQARTSSLRCSGGSEPFRRLLTADSQHGLTLAILLRDE